MTLPRGVALAVGVMAVLVGCAKDISSGFRDTDRPIGASTRFDRAAFAGDWAIVARFGAPTGGALRFTSTLEGIDVLSEAVLQLTGPYREGAPGELVPISETQEPLVVMWVDADFETAAIGTASGSFGAVIDRDGVLPADRASAAYEILKFYGWDTTALQRTEL